jgi:ppGpp synthetase/RelA/SpoT-type nucleotidyltranferase
MGKSYTLDAHGEELLQQYRDRLPVFERMEKLAYDALHWTFQRQGIYITSLEHRIKEEQSLAGKLELKGAKYKSLADVTDILGLRVITFYTDDVDKVAAIVKQVFDVDWKESVDKRKLHQLTSFGYNSLHYICRLPKSIVDDPEMPQLNEYRFEIQMRTALQHVWSTIEHDVGYKGAVKIPGEYRRQFSRLSGMLELIDDEFSRLRTTLIDYRRKMQSLVASGLLDEVPLEFESFQHYLETKPFDRLNKRIAAVNQAEVYPVSMLPFLPVLESFGMASLGDVQRLLDEHAEDAYQLALSQLAFTDLDIISESVGLMNLCIVQVLKRGEGVAGLKHLYDQLNGEDANNEKLAAMTFEQASNIPHEL